MKKIIISIIFLMLTLHVFAENLDATREFVKMQAPEIYINIKTRAISEWQTDHEMILYVITNQCVAFMHTLQLINNDNENYNIFIPAIEDWSYDIETVNKNFDLIDNNITSDRWLLELDVDWEMIEYTMLNQIKAKGLY